MAANEMGATTRIAPEPWARVDPDEVRELTAQIDRLRREKDAIIFAHNYQIPEIQDIADLTGDSLGLSIEGQKCSQQTIIFCGVTFMAESAKILSPEKTVLLPHLAAGCSLSDSITADSLLDWKERYPDHTVVTYVNSSAEVKALSDICCTSANAVSVVKSLDNDKVLFTPDRNLGAWVKRHVTDKEIVVYDGACPTHDVLRGINVDKAAADREDTIIIAHPECRDDVIEMADEVCSTTGMIDAVKRHPDAKTFVIATEWALVHKLKQMYPDKEFIVADGCIGCRLHCPYMKMIDLKTLKRSLEENVFEIDVPPDVIEGARKSLERMLAVPRD
jgi:quinolinate synthase